MAIGNYDSSEENLAQVSLTFCRDHLEKLDQKVDLESLEQRFVFFHREFRV